MKTRRQIESTPVDSGYSWVVLLATTGIYTIIAGTAKSYAILYTEFLMYFGTGSGNTAWIASVNMLLFLGLGPISNRLSEIFSFRTVISCGGVLYSLGLLLSAFVHKMEMLYLTIGITSGIGAGLIFTPTSTVLSFYFQKRRAFANGLMISGSGVGTFLFPYLYRYLIDIFGIQGTLMVLSAIGFNMCVFAGLLRQPLQLVRKFQPKVDHTTDTFDKKHESEELKEYETKNEALLQPENCEPSAKKSLSLASLIDLSLLRNPSFVMYALVFMLNTMAFQANYIVIAPKILELGFGKSRVAVALSIAGISEIFSKFFFGWLADLKIFKVKYLLVMTFIVSGITTALIPLFSSFIAYAVYAGIVGVFPGSYFTLLAVTMLQCIEITDLPSAFGLTTLFMSVGAFFSQPVAGWIEDATGTWDYSFLYVSCVYVLAAVFTFGEPLFKRYWCFKRIDTENKDNIKTEVAPDLV